jgi:hypothetical protein
MTASHGDICPACSSHDVLPYAVIVGGSEEYGYQRQSCEVTWPVLSYREPITSVATASLRYRALGDRTERTNEGPEGEPNHAGAAACGHSRSSSLPQPSGSRPTASRS